MLQHNTKFRLKIILVFVSDKGRPYLIVKAVVRLSDPAAMDLVLRKRISFNVYKRHSITDKIRRKMGHTSNLTSLGVTYEIVSNIPKVKKNISFAVHWINLISLFSIKQLCFQIVCPANNSNNIGTLKNIFASCKRIDTVGRFRFTTASFTILT